MFPNAALPGNSTQVHRNQTNSFHRIEKRITADQANDLLYEFKATQFGRLGSYSCIYTLPLQKKVKIK